MYISIFYPYSNSCDTSFQMKKLRVTGSQEERAGSLMLPDQALSPPCQCRSNSIPVHTAAVVGFCVSLSHNESNLKISAISDLYLPPASLDLKLWGTDFSVFDNPKHSTTLGPQPFVTFWNSRNTVQWRPCLTRPGREAMSNVKPALKFVNYFSLFLSIACYNQPAWTEFSCFCFVFFLLYVSFQPGNVLSRGSRTCYSPSKAGVKMILPTGFHEPAVSQFLVLFSISLCTCPHSLSQVCIIWTIMEPTSRGAMTSGWPWLADALPCSPITRICRGDYSLLRPLEAYSFVRSLPLFSGIGWLLDPPGISLLGWHVCSLWNENSRAVVGLSYWKNCNFPLLGLFSLDDGL